MNFVLRLYREFGNNKKKITFESISKSRFHLNIVFEKNSDQNNYFYEKKSFILVLSSQVMFTLDILRDK